MTKPTGRGIMGSVPHEDPSDYEVLLILTKVFFGSPNKRMASNLYRISRLGIAGRVVEEEE